MKTETQEKEKGYHIMIDQKPYNWPNQFITGADIKSLANVDMGFGVWLKVNGPGDDIPIGDQEKVDLSPNGREHFFTGPTQTTEG